MTGAYLFGKNKDGKTVPIEIEFLTKEERTKSMIGRSEDELIDWIHLLCKELKRVDEFLKD